MYLLQFTDYIKYIYMIGIESITYSEHGSFVLDALRWVHTHTYCLLSPRKTES